MQTMHPTLLVGPGDWDPQQIPRKDYDDRLAALWRDHEGAGGAIVYGNSRDHAALFYLTHFTPKLEAAIALIPRRGEPQMLIGGGPNMLPAAKPLTFISALAPLRDAPKSTIDWARGLDAGSRLVLIGGEAMPFDLRRRLEQGLGTRLEDGDPLLQTRMRRKSAREVEILRQSCLTLDAAIAALRDTVRKNKSVTDCILVAEHTALQRGAQDVRSLFSLDGGRTFRPFDIPIAQHAEPLSVYLAVCHGGYWADAFVRIAAQDDALERKAARILHAMVAAAKPGLPVSDLHRIAEMNRGACRLHPLADREFGSSIGLSVDELPLLTPDSTATLETGAVYSLRAGLVDDARMGAVVSGMVLVTDDGPQVLWPIDGLP